jgi:serine/threonine protein kinase
MVAEQASAAPRNIREGGRSTKRRVREALDMLARELDTLPGTEQPSGLTGRLAHAVAGLHTSWSAVKALSRAAGKLAAPAPAIVAAGTIASRATSHEVSRNSRYQLGERLGGGGMGEVFRGWHIGVGGFERPVAIKRILSKFADADQYKAMFTYEADVLARLSHPNIVGVLDLTHDEHGHLLMVLEYVDGVDLGRLLESGPVPPSVAMFLGAEILTGLGYAHHLPANGSHALGVVHRDLSPSNILLSWDGAVKIADFGIAKMRNTTEVSMMLDVQGKPGFMAPEQLNAQPLDGRADLFSLGVMLWEMLAGRRLFPHQKRTTTDDPAFGRPVRPGVHRSVPRDLERVVMKLLRRDRRRRYRTAEDAFDALARCDGASWLRGRVDLVELLAQRFPAQAAWRPTRRPGLPHTPTVTPPLPLPLGFKQAPLWKRWPRVRPLWKRWRRAMRRRRWQRQRQLARRLHRGARWSPIAIVVLCVAAMVGLAVWVVTARGAVPWR